LLLVPLRHSSREVEDQREAERARREGAAYKSKEERAKEARDAKDRFRNGEEAISLDRKVDPRKDYYGVLCIDRAAAAAEVRRAYKRLSLLHHPDKHRGEGPEQQEAIAQKFKDIVEAFDVLIDEEQRAVSFPSLSSLTHSLLFEFHVFFLFKKFFF
jgi:DnaJ-domain-containing protein 1